MNERMIFRLEREGTSIEYKTDSVTWDELMSEFAQFLRGCGFYIKDGEWVEWDEREPTTDNS